MRPDDPDMVRDYIVRVHGLDPTGIPWDEPMVGRGAFAYQVLSIDGDDDGVDWSASVRYGPLRVGLRTNATARAARQGPGNYCLEVFAPANDYTWFYVVFPKVVGAVLQVPSGADQFLYSITGTVSPNRHLPPLIGQDFRPPGDDATMYQTRTRAFRPFDMLAAPKMGAAK